jgi:hypothetical protein
MGESEMRKIVAKKVWTVTPYEWLDIKRLPKDHEGLRFYVHVNSWLSKTDLKKLKREIDKLIKQDDK